MYYRCRLELSPYMARASLKVPSVKVSKYLHKTNTFRSTMGWITETEKILQMKKAVCSYKRDRSG